MVGPSGSGKTTVANLVMRFLETRRRHDPRRAAPTSTHAPADWVRSQIALVAQSTFLFTGSLRDNLLVAAPRRQRRRDCTQALADADLTDFVGALPAGLDTPVGERGLSVSGGQAQRIAIARAFLKDAPILVLDEPTSNIDLTSEAAIVAAIDRLSVGRTVAHDRPPALDGPPCRPHRRPGRRPGDRVRQPRRAHRTGRPLRPSDRAHAEGVSDDRHDDRPDRRMRPPTDR